MKKIVKCMCFTLGVALLVAALSLVLYNVNRDKTSGENAQKIVSRLILEIPETTEPTTAFKEKEEYDLIAEYEQTSEATEEADASEDIPTIELDGYYYMGIIAIPSIDIELPILREWSYPNLQISPCRYQGTTGENNIIIAAHNYWSHFGKIGNLNTGDEIYIKEVTGNICSYEVDSIEHVRGTDIERMNFGSGEEWDLTLFTCTLDGQSRVTVRAIRNDIKNGGDTYEE